MKEQLAFVKRNSSISNVLENYIIVVLEIN